MFCGISDAVRENKCKEAGQAFVEYALILAFVALAALTGLTLMAGSVNDALELVESALAAAAGG
jgi:Flp pilus assembly pilin Flp